MTAPLLTIQRGRGDESPVRLTFDGFPRLDDVTAARLEVLESDGTTPVETLTGEMRGFDPGIWFPVINGDWAGTRKFRVVLVRGAEDGVLNGLHSWVQS